MTNPTRGPFVVFIEGDDDPECLGRRCFECNAAAGVWCDLWHLPPARSLGFACHKRVFGGCDEPGCLERDWDEASGLCRYHLEEAEAMPDEDATDYQDAQDGILPAHASELKGGAKA